MGYYEDGYKYGYDKGQDAYANRDHPLAGAFEAFEESMTSVGDAFFEACGLGLDDDQKEDYEEGAKAGFRDGWRDARRDDSERDDSESDRDDDDDD